MSVIYLPVSFVQNENNKSWLYAIYHYPGRVFFALSISDHYMEQASMIFQGKSTLFLH